jgi:hypothetical protein
MRRWQNIVAVVGFLGVVAFAVDHLVRSGTSWTDLKNLGPDVVKVELIYSVVALTFLGLLRGGHALWGVTRQELPANAVVTDRQHSSARGRSRTSWAGVLSFLLAMAAESLTGRRTPGMFVVGTILMRLRLHVSFLGLLAYFVMPLVLDGALCFAILWGGYLLWEAAGGKPRGRNSEAEK